MATLRRATLLVTAVSVWAAEASPIPDSVDFFPAEDVLWPIASTLMLGGAFVALAVVTGVLAGAVWIAVASRRGDDRRVRPARVDRPGHVVAGPFRSGGEWLRAVELPGGRRRVEVLTRAGWVEHDPLRSTLALGVPPARREP